MCWMHSKILKQKLKMNALKNSIVEIDTEIYMIQPELYVKNPQQVCFLHKSLYGLKQASRLWNAKLSNALKEIGMQQSKTDLCLYFNVKENSYIAVWVDDLILFTSQENMRDMLKEQLKQHFEMKDLGQASQCVGLNITKKAMQ